MNTDKYNLSLGFATLVISLSAFKSELSQIHIHVGQIPISLADYLFYAILALSFGLYLYFSEQIYYQTPPFSRLNLKILPQIAFFIILLVIISPIVLTVFQILYVINRFLKHWEYLEIVTKLLQIINLLVSIAAAFLATRYHFKLRESKKKENQ
jgi:hypothetical protein